MTSFRAELQVAGSIFPLTHCYVGVQQGMHQRGRVSTKVRYEPVQLTLDVPEESTLLSWAAAPQKRLATTIVFLSPDGGSAIETLRLPGAYCTSYQEIFQAGNALEGAYQCLLVLSDPEGFTLQQGGPDSTFVAPAPREYQLTQSPLTLATNLLARPLLKNEADPIQDIFGPGKLSHPNEWASTLNRLRAEGVEIIHRKGVMAYGPAPASGRPGQLLLDENASIGALRHEARHYADDKALGFPGAIRYFQEPAVRWQTEFNAYMEEVSLARQVRRFDVGHDLVQNARNEKSYLIENFNLGR
jgi:hypothetical protein